MAVEGFHAFNDGVYVVSAVRTVHLINIYGVYGIQFQNVVVHTHQRIVYLRAMDERGVRQHAYFGFRAILIAQTDGVVYDFGKMRMARRLTIACKGQHIGQQPFCLHLLKLCLQFLCHFLTCRLRQGGAMVFVEAALAIDAVKRAYLAIGRQQIDAERDAQAATMYGAENRRSIYYCTHNGDKIIK